MSVSKFGFKSYYLLFLLLVFSFTINKAVNIDDKWNKTFSVKEGGTLKVDSDLGSIVVTTGSKDKVEVKISSKNYSKDSNDLENLLNNLDISFNQKQNNVYVGVEYKGGHFFKWKSNRLNLLLDIKVPYKFNVDLKTAGGSINVDDLEGNVQTNTSGGSMIFGNIKGSVRGQTSGGSIKAGFVDGTTDMATSGGSITVEGANGDVSVSTSGGSITVNESKGTINASTSGGSINVHITSQPDNNCKLTTSGGSINLYLKSDIDADIDAATTGGKVKTDFPVTIQGELNGNRIKAVINNGGPELYLRTTGGNIHIREI